MVDKIDEFLINKTVSLKQSLYDEMVAHARRDDPNECCGVMAGKDGIILKLYPTTNEEKSPLTYSIPSQELFNALRDMETRGLELIGMYHSHTQEGAYLKECNKSSNTIRDYTSGSNVHVEGGAIRGANGARAYPSDTDVKLAFWPESIYFIISLAPPDPAVRAFTITEGKITEVDFSVTQ